MKALDFFSQPLCGHEALFTDPVWLGLRKLPEYLRDLKGDKTLSFEGVTLIRPELIQIGEGCVIEPGCLIEGPCVIGSGTVVRHGAAVRGLTVIGKRCVIGHASEVKRSILFDDAKAPHFNYVGDSILGREVNLGAGVKFANLRLDRGEIKVRGQGNVYKTGMQKLGGIIGDGCQIGCNCVVNPGTLMLPGFVVPPCQSIPGGVHGRCQAAL